MGDSIFMDILHIILMDLVVVLCIFVLLYFITVIIDALRNGKVHKLTDENLMVYSLKHYCRTIEKNAPQLLKWILIFFVIHLCFGFFDSILTWGSSFVSYDKAPLLALAVDIVKPLINVVMPFILPVLIVTIVSIVIYALAKTMAENARNKDANLPATNNTNNKALCFTENIQRGFMGIVKFLPKIFIVLVICIGLNSVFVSISNITKVIDEFQEIQELNLTVKNLSNSEAFARISLLRQRENSAGGKSVPVKTYKIDILSADGDVISSETMELEGNEIVLDSININFDYSKIANGEKYNIAYPYRVYSDVIPAAKAKPLSCMYNDEKIPVIYCLENDEIYGMDNDVYYSRLAEIFDIVKDENLSREMGIRSTVGNAVHFVMSKDDIIDIYIEGTGGISAKKHESLY